MAAPPWRRNVRAGAGTRGGGPIETATSNFGCSPRSRCSGSAPCCWRRDRSARAQAQRLLQLSSAKHSVAVTVAFGKTEDVRIDAAFTDITIGDSDVADISPLTDRTHLHPGQEDRHHAGHRSTATARCRSASSTSRSPTTSPRLAAEIGHFSDGSIKVSSVNGRIMLSGTVAGRRRRSIAADGHRPPVRARSRSTRCQVMQAQQVMLEVRFVEASRQAGRALGVQWNSFGQNTLANIGNRLPANQLPVTQPKGAFSESRSDCRRRRPQRKSAGFDHLADRGRRRARRGHALWFPARRAQSRRPVHRRRLERARAEGPCPQPGGAQPGGAVRRHRELPRRRRVPDPGSGLARHP